MISNGVHVGDGLSSMPLTHGDQPSTTEARECPHHVQLQHGLGNRASKASNHEADGGDEEADSSSKHVRKPTVQRLKGRTSDQIRRRQPRRIVRSIEVGTDGGVC